MAKKIKFKIEMTRKWRYLLISILLFSILAVGVYAYSQSAPDPGHTAEEVYLRNSSGILISMQDAFNRLISDNSADFVCASFKMDINSGSISAVGNTGGGTYTTMAVVRGPKKTVITEEYYDSISCNQTFGWVMTGCSSTTEYTGYNTEKMGANSCIGPFTWATDYIYIRCCNYERSLFPTVGGESTPESDG